MTLLHDKTALVTGGTTGIGLAAAQRLAAEGAHVFLTGRTQSTLDAAVASIGPGATGIRSDVNSLDDLDALVEAITAYGHGLDVVFANAGGGEFAALADVTAQHLLDTFTRNVGGTLFTVQKMLPILNSGASIVLTGSTSASNGTPSFGVYAASKAAIRSFGRTWAAELVSRNIRVNTVVPPIVHIVRLYLGDGSNAEPVRKHLVSGPTPMLRPGTPGRLLAAGIVPNPPAELDDELLLSGRAQRIGDREIILYKPRWGAFFGTTLDEYLRANNIDTVVVAGCNYPNCPRTSIYEASERDYRVVLVEDAVSGLYDRGHTEMTNIGVTLCRSKWVVDHLAQKPNS